MSASGSGEADQPQGTGVAPVPQAGEAAEATSPFGRPPAPALAEGGLGRRLATSFGGVRDDLESRSREWTRALRLIEQSRALVDAAESDAAAAYAELDVLIPRVQQALREVQGAAAAARAGERAPDLEDLFSTQARVLDRLESLSVHLAELALRHQTAWEQYVQRMQAARTLQAELQRLP